MTYIKCSGCGEIVDIPPELAGEELGEVFPDGTFFCDACDHDWGFGGGAIGDFGEYDDDWQP